MWSRLLGPRLRSYAKYFSHWALSIIKNYLWQSGVQPLFPRTATAWNHFNSNMLISWFTHFSNMWSSCRTTCGPSESSGQPVRKLPERWALYNLEIKLFLQPELDLNEKLFWSNSFMRLKNDQRRMRSIQKSRRKSYRQLLGNLGKFTPPFKGFLVKKAAKTG